MCSRYRPLNRGIKPDSLQRSLPVLIILRFCEEKKKKKAYSIHKRIRQGAFCGKYYPLEMVIFFPSQSQFQDKSHFLISF